MGGGTSFLLGIRIEARKEEEEEGRREREGGGRGGKEVKAIDTR